MSTAFGGSGHPSPGTKTPTSLPATELLNRELPLLSSPSGFLLLFYRGLVGVAGRLSGTVSPFRVEQGTSLETPSRARTSSCQELGTTWFYSSCGTEHHQPPRITSLTCPLLITIPSLFQKFNTIDEFCF